MKKTILQILILLFVSVQIKAQAVPEYWGSLKKGKYGVGFKSYLTFDASRKYDLTCDDSTVVIKNINSGRPILINLFYPAVIKKDAVPITIKEYFDFPETDDTKTFFKKLKKLQLNNSKRYVVDYNIKVSNFSGDTSIVNKTREEVFEKYLALKTISVKNGEPISGEFPVLIYHQGLGGTLDEDFLFLEYLVSHGYIVVMSGFQNGDSGFGVGTGKTKTSLDDYNFIIGHLKKEGTLKNQKIFLAGHSLGAINSTAFISEGGNNIDGVVSLDAGLDYGLSFNTNPHDSLTNWSLPGKKNSHGVPFMIITGSKAYFRFSDALIDSRRIYIALSDMEHNDYAGQGAVGNLLSMPHVKNPEEVLYRYNTYLDLCPLILKFLESNVNHAVAFSKNDIVPKKGWRIEVLEKGETTPFNSKFDKASNKCPSISQWMDIILNEGLAEGQKFESCMPEILKNDAKLMDVFEALFYDGKTELAMNFLNWINTAYPDKVNNRTLFLIAVNDYCQGGDKDSLTKHSKIICNWQIEKHPESIYGYLGKARAADLLKNYDAAIELYKKAIELESPLKIKAMGHLERFVTDELEWRLNHNKKKD